MVSFEGGGWDLALNFRNLSIRKKMTALMVLISVLILLLVGSLYIVEEVYSSRTSLNREMTTLGETLGDSCKKLLMLREISATEGILASLKVQANIRAAYLFDESGHPVAQYLDPTDMRFVLDVIPRDFVDSEARFWINLSGPSVTSSWRHFGLFLPIKHGDRQIGSIYLLSDLRDLYGRLSGVVFIVLMMLGILLVLSWWLAGRLQRPVSEPLLNLVETMGAISQSKDYSLRAQKQGRDEVGLLVDGFNRMLEQIEVNRQELVDHQQSLEITVEKRTEELRQMVSILKLAKQQAEAASEAKSQFLANITHELRTPLIGVLGMNELLFRTSMDEQQQMLATTVQNSGEDLLILINNVLDFSKIEAGKLQLEETEFALYQVVDEVLGLLAGTADEKGLALYSEISLAATCRVLGDRVRIRQILMNLVGNAIKFTEQGSVTVKLNCQSTDSSGAVFTLEIHDTGIGMEADTQQQLFSAFYQADTSHTRKYGGTGLGLAIVRQLVQLLKGSIELESSVGEGSCFRVEFALPLVTAGKFDLPDSLQQQPVLLHTFDPVCQQLLARRLEELGMTVVTAKSVADAWYKLGSATRSGQPFSLLFISADLFLPDGQPLYTAIRTEQSLVGLRRILLLPQSQQLEVRQQERRLYLPVGWDTLHETLCQSWHELRLIGKSAPAVDDPAIHKQTSAKLSLLLAGGNVASRELIKVSLADLPLAFESAVDFSQLIAKSSKRTYGVTFVDLATVPVESLLDFCRQRPDCILYVFCSSIDCIDPLLPYISGAVEKPFKREQFLPLLQPHIDAMHASQAKLVADGGGEA